jgi:O-antigen ligase
MLSRHLIDPHRWLLGFALAYLALLPTNSATFLRSVAFGGAVLFALIVYARSWRDPATRIPFAGAAVLGPLLAWALWSTASLLWSARPRYSFLQLEREVMDSLLAIFVFYVAARDTASLRALVVAALASFAAFAAFAIAMLMRHGSWDASLHHHGVGPYSTWVVLTAPLLLLLIAPPPAGFGNGLRSALPAAVLLTLMVVTARMTDNRMVWIALAVVFAVISLAIVLRWPGAWRRLRGLLPLAALMLALALAFNDALTERGHLYDPPQDGIATALENDPRFLLWDRVRAKIGERPLVGFGFGRAIVAFDVADHERSLRRAHAHNLVLSQWLQTGLVGAALFVALLAALGWRYLRFVRSPDDRLAAAGVLGLALLAGFAVKNVTDDFLFRSNAKEFWALCAMLLGYGVRRQIDLARTAAVSVSGEREAAAERRRPGAPIPPESA